MFNFPKPEEEQQLKLAMFDLLDGEPEDVADKINDFLATFPVIIKTEKIHIKAETAFDQELGRLEILQKAQELKLFYYNERRIEEDAGFTGTNNPGTSTKKSKSK